MHLKKEPPIPIPKLRKWSVVRKPEESIEDASPKELSYLAALVDGEGCLDIHHTQPRIIITMKSVLPVRLAKRYGGYWYVRLNKRRGTIYYSWYIQQKTLLKNFVERVALYSLDKRAEFALLHEAVEIRETKPSGWKARIREIAGILKELHHRNPRVIFEAAQHLDKKKPGWRDWVQPGTIIESEP